jgi:hypothetical protein
MNAGTCWGKNTIDPRGRDVERPSKATLTLTYQDATQNEGTRDKKTLSLKSSSELLFNDKDNKEIKEIIAE